MIEFGVDGSIVVNVFNEKAAIAKKVIMLLVGLFDFHATLKVEHSLAKGKNHRYIINLHGSKLPQILNELGIISDDMSRIYLPPIRLLTKQCCATAYLRGSFLASGSISDTESGYHLEVSLPDEKFSKSIIEVLKRSGINAKHYKRKHDYPVYIKGFDSIVSFLALTGAYSILLKWENKKIIKELKNHANRLANCDSANVNKIVNAAMEQISDILFISKAVGLDNLPMSLKEVARARLDFPEVSLFELGQKINPPISKSAVYHRLVRIGKLANKATV